MDVDFHVYMPVLTIIGTLTLGAMSPGPSFIFVVRCAVSLSRWHGISTAIGMGTGALILSIAALLGLQTIFSVMPISFILFKVCGGCYLIFLAFGIVKSASIQLQTIDTKGSNNASLFRSYFLGLGTQLSNAKTMIVFARVFTTLLPQNIPTSFYIAIPICTFLSNTGWYLAVALILSVKGPRCTYLRFKKLFDYLSASVIGVLGAKLMVSN
ncbi:LysE family translocator [Vibrio sp. ZSDE26]|uniref:LysE family translocator n=1 Tax=Vibrio amylolyticus TaxID=2847292 RepID=A0A9X1XJP9_9VIBR|nr:LysE family translocator [Vibrio amylolyticus]MCK6264492.1 LysE family translocator [Vibrio amylolyticus]